MARDSHISDGAGVERSMRPFFVLWSGQALSLLGSEIAQFALIWWLALETGSGTVLATATLVGLVPQVVLGPLIGTFVDRWRRQRILIVADLVIAAASAVLAFLFLSGTIEVWHFFVLLFVRAVAGGFHRPTMTASTSLMVPERHLTRVQGLNESLGGALAIVAAPIAAFLLGLMPMAAILALDVVTAIFAIAPLFVIRVPQPVADGGARRSSVLDDLRVGLRYVWGWPGLMALLAMAGLVNLLLTPAFSLLPLLVREHLGGDALRLGWLMSAFGVGTVLGGALIGVWGGFRQRMLTVLTGLFGLGVAVWTVGLAPPRFAATLAGMFAVGVAMTFINGPIVALMQARVAPSIQGRIFTLLSAISSACTPLGLMIAGPVADLAGIRSWYLVGGAACVLLGVAGFFIPVVRGLEQQVPERVAATGAGIADAEPADAEP